ncbi:dihydrofolate reductase family protein [Photobacterium sp. CCB-ST2H9]|uniref:dihydrofolate reductase family protein n=1 Tax=unclassified Photobacterium TaxID=2628852 RepID=UPI00200642FE|nr:dihydrofolate reductase family protein [Photobacterium sp. CCB-ST2H9]UTM60179.1 dihydrofolate reductase family protein [Photobacterium sp. CCB-ST2H9]
MAHLIYSLNMSLNGYCHPEDRVADQSRYEYALEVLLSADAFLLERATYDLLTPYWPEAVTKSDLPKYMQYLALELQSIPKYVVSSQPLTYAWHNTEVICGEGIDQVSQFLNGVSGTVVLFDSPALGAALVEAALINEYHLLVMPFIGTQEKRAFEGVKTKQKLALQVAQKLSKDMALLKYTPEYEC